MSIFHDPYSKPHFRIWTHPPYTPIFKSGPKIYNNGVSSWKVYAKIHMITILGDTLFYLVWPVVATVKSRHPRWVRGERIFNERRISRRISYWECATMHEPLMLNILLRLQMWFDFNELWCILIQIYRGIDHLVLFVIHCRLVDDPTQKKLYRRVGVTSNAQLKRCIPSCRVHAIVICKLQGRNVRIPVHVAIRMCERARHLTDCADVPFSQPIRSWSFSGGHI